MDERVYNTVWLFSRSRRNRDSDKSNNVIYISKSKTSY